MTRMYENAPMGGNAGVPDPSANEHRTPRTQMFGSRSEHPPSAEAEPSPGAVQDAAKDLVMAAKDLRDTTHSYVKHQARERPYVLLGGAAALGFVLGGGLASRVTVSLLVVGARMFGGRLLTKVIEGELEVAAGREGEPDRT